MESILRKVGIVFIVTILVIVGLLGVLLLSSCEKGTDNKLAEKQEVLMQEANAQVGMPAIKNFQERKLMKIILELRDDANLICYAYIVAEQTGKLVFIGKCIGYGLPYSTQYTNPMKPITGSYPAAVSETAIPQADPNGLFMPQSADGTWLILIDPKTNEPKPAYFEPRVIVSQFRLDE